MNFLPKHDADSADEIVDRLLDLIDLEPSGTRESLLASIKAGRHHVYRQDDGRSIVTFDGLDVQYEIRRTPRLDA